jgi:hypothetical protein
MPTLKETLTGWRDRAEIDWFGQFVQTWIPFNAWMTHTFGDLTDKELTNHVKSDGNSVRNRIVPMLTPTLPMAKGAPTGWKDDSPDAQQFRRRCGDLHRLLQSCEIASRRGRLSFESVDIGDNKKLDDQQHSYGRQFRVRRHHPAKGEYLLEVSGTKNNAAVSIQIQSYDWDIVQVDAGFLTLELGHQTRLKAMFENVAPRLIRNVLQPHGKPGGLACGDAVFIPEPEQVFSALVDIIYGLRNALFHGSITPNQQHNEIYEPAYHLVMRLVRCTI